MRWPQNCGLPNILLNGYLHKHVSLRCILGLDADLIVLLHYMTHEPPFLQDGWKVKYWNAGPQFGITNWQKLEGSVLVHNINVYRRIVSRWSSGNVIHCRSTFYLIVCFLIFLSCTLIFVTIEGKCQDGDASSHELCQALGKRIICLGKHSTHRPLGGALCHITSVYWFVLHCVSWELWSICTLLVVMPKTSRHRGVCSCSSIYLVVILSLTQQLLSQVTLVCTYDAFVSRICEYVCILCGSCLYFK